MTTTVLLVALGLMSTAAASWFVAARRWERLANTYAKHLEAKDRFIAAMERRLVAEARWHELLRQRDRENLNGESQQTDDLASARHPQSGRGTQGGAA